MLLFELHGNMSYLLLWTTAHAAGLERNLPMLEWLALLWTLELILRSQCSSEWQLSEKPVYIVICLLWPMKVSFDLLILYKLFYLNDCLVLQNNLKGPQTEFDHILYYSEIFKIFDFVSKWQQYQLFQLVTASLCSFLLMSFFVYFFITSNTK